MNPEDVPMTPWTVQDNIIIDANGERVTMILGDWLSSQQNCELAQFITDAVNWKVREDAP
jgi:hypothetical protein